MQRIDITIPKRAGVAADLPFGGTNRVTGETLGVTSRYFTRNGKPWFPIMGEFHYSRYDHRQWEREILKMKAGGITVVASYVFWIHHEEIEGVFDWSGDRNLDGFLAACEKHGMKLLLRIGPWAHGEARNGGFPDWLGQKGCELRSNNPEYLGCVDKLYGEIFKQAASHLFEDGGCIIGIQLENEYGHCGGFTGEKGREHMRMLKRMAVEKSFAVPYYTATGWGGAVVVEGEMLPVMGAYADAPWDQDVKELPANPNFLFSHLLNDENIGSDQAMRKRAEFTYDPSKYPYATAELGGGIQVTKHRRPVVTALDTQAMIFARFGSGANLLGYYMYHGGTNPKGKRTTLQESYASGGYNDLPILSYDFQGAIGEYGQLHDACRYLKILHMLAVDFGEQFAGAISHIPPQSARDPEDLDSLRLSVLRADSMGLLCLTCHQRHRALRDQRDLHITVEGIPFPAFDLLRGESIAYPFAWDVAGLHIDYATAQPLCRVEASGSVTLFFWNYRDSMQISIGGEAVAIGQNVRHAHTGADGQSVYVVLLSRKQAENAWKVETPAGESLLITKAGVINPGGTVVLHSLRGEGEVLQYPSGSDALFHRRIVQLPALLPDVDVSYEAIDESTYRIHLPDGYAEGGTPFLHIDFEGNLANLCLGGERIADWFYTGLPWRVGLQKFGDTLRGELILRIEPLAEDARIYLEAQPHYENGIAASLRGIRLERYGEVGL